MKRIFNTGLIILFSVFILQLFLACGAGKKMSPQSARHKPAVALLNTGNQLYKKGCYESALEHAFKAHELFTLADHQSGVAKSLNNIGNIYRAKKEGESALLFFDEAIRIFKTIDDDYGVVQAISNKSAVYIDLKLFDKAETYLNEADRLSASGGFTYPPALNNRGIFLIRQKKYTEAEEVLLKALAIIDKENYFEYTAANYALGNLMVETNQRAKAEGYFMKALKVDRDVGYNKGIAGDLFALGSLLVVSGDYNAACDYLRRSLNVYTLLNDRENMETVFLLLKKAAASASGDAADIKITEYFIDLWRSGKRLTPPCE